MLSESTARLVESAAILGEPEMVHIEGSGEAVPAQRLVAVAVQPIRFGQSDTTFVGCQWELNTLAGILDRSIAGQGCVGKTRLVGEAVQLSMAS
jgi:hypothetical protein